MLLPQQAFAQAHSALRLKWGAGPAFALAKSERGLMQVRDRK